ncbi:MAG: hypothetical protein AAB369_03570 [Chloroflexota bacterium]
MISLNSAPFSALGRSTARTMGIEKLAIVEVPWPLNSKDAPQTVDRIAQMLQHPIETKPVK